MNKSFIKASIEKIKNASENNKLVIFVGAGVSVNSGMPTWGGLVNAFANELGITIEKNDFSIETYLKIPQYYFNERGEKEYNDKIRDVFSSKKYHPNAIHEEIFKLNPKHIVTTNYDDLLEQAAIKHSGFFHTVREDADLPYNNTDKMIIKMHGDLNTKNIVLKEDDYLSYSQDFMLIENYLKSLIATNVVLFIGYSANDPNFKIIFQWVKGLLRGHFQPAYLLDIKEDATSMEFNYYKNRGINILYYSEVKDQVTACNVFGEGNILGNNLYNYLSFINELIPSHYMDDIDLTYKKLSIFEKINFVMADDIIKALDMGKATYDNSGNKEINFHDDTIPIIKVLSQDNIQENDSYKVKEIFNTLKKANINEVRSKDEVIIKLGEQDLTISENLKHIMEFNFSGLDTQTQLFTGHSVGLQDYYEMLEKAFILYKTNEYFKAYQVYKHISFLSFSNKEYLIHFISEFNRKHVGKLVVQYSFDKGLDRKEVNNELNKIDLETIYLKLPQKIRKTLHFLKNLTNLQFVYKNIVSLNKEVESIKKTKKLLDRGGYSTNFSIISSIHLTENLWSYINKNFLCIEHYTELKTLYKNFVEGILASYSTISESRDSFFKLPITKVLSLDPFGVYIMANFIKADELEDLFMEYSIDIIKIEPEAKNHLLSSFSNLTESIIQLNNSNEISSFLHNLLTILSRIELHDKDQELIFRNIGVLLKMNLLTITEEKFINRIIVKKANEKSLSKDIAYNLLINYLELYISSNNVIDYYHGRLFKNLTIILNEDSDSLSSKGVILETLYHGEELLENNLIKELHQFLLQILIPLYNIVDSAGQKIIKDIINSLKKSDMNIDMYDKFVVDIYGLSVINNIIGPEEYLNEKFVEIIKKTITENIERKSSPCPIETVLNKFTELVRYKHLDHTIYLESLNEFKGYSQYFDLIFFSADIELKELEIELLTILKPEEQKKLMENRDTSSNIYKFIEREMFKIQNEKLARDIFNQYFKRKFE